VLKEAMRLYPPAYVISRAARAPVSVGGHALAAGELVFASVYGLHRRAAPFADPERFAPERFLDGAERAWPRGSYVPFGAGPRVCVGNHFATMEGQLVLARLAQRFELDGAVAALAAPRPLITLRPGAPMPFALRPRPAVRAVL